MSAELNAQFHEHVRILFAKFAPGSIDRMIHAGMGMTTETGEINDTLKRAWVYEQDMDNENIEEELGDLLFYLVAMANEQGLTLERIMRHNMAKLAKRYPEGYSNEAATVRADKVGAE